MAHGTAYVGGRLRVCDVSVSHEPGGLVVIAPALVAGASIDRPIVVDVASDGASNCGGRAVGRKSRPVRAAVIVVAHRHLLVGFGHKSKSTR
jgi:hypothetical protein